MSTTCIRSFTRLHILLSRQAATRPRLKTIYHAGSKIPNLRPLSSTPFRPVKARELRDQDLFAKPHFALSDVPPLSFWTSNVGPPIVLDGEVSPVECLEACRRYASLALENAPGWQRRSITTSTTTTGKRASAPIPISILHYVALILLRVRGERQYMAAHILYTGTTLNYAPAVLTMARLGVNASMLDKPAFAVAKEALGRLASSRASDPYYRADALTLLGLHHAQRGTPEGDNRALRCFEDAEKAAQAPDAAWQWRASAVLEQSRILVRREQEDRAREALRAALELDNADVCFAYAMLLPADDPERTPLLQRAAVSGVKGAAREMARIEERRAAEEGLGATERRIRQVIADEWAAIAGDKAVLE
ncbi:hypothetical protein F5Y05DRAFT_24230 [Hypoxylon sp. FL0543]|nr:hypothetical protein F5Y05DRAFT_24230 [Hypoxylon sp. FL0543]